MNRFVIPPYEAPTGDDLSEYLIASIEAFSNMTDVPVTYFRDREIVTEFHKENKICNIFQVYTECDSACRRNLLSAGQLAFLLGEPYIFLCKAGLANIAVSLVIDGAFAGYLVAGPIVMGQLRNSTTRSFSALNHLDDAALSIAKMFAGKMRVYQPNQVSQLALLFYNSIVTSVSGLAGYNQLRSRYDEQNKINLDIQNTKRKHAAIEYPYEREKSLLQHVSEGLVAEATEDIRKLLNDFSILEAGSLEDIKTKVLWLFAIVIRIAGRAETQLSQPIDTDMDIINRISDADSFTELQRVSESLIQRITGNMLSSIYSGRSQIVAKALQFINKNFKEKISLRDIENNLHVNASYFSTLFKAEMGVTFTDYLNALKIEHACHLLTHTNLSIIDISLSTGFEDQSYFTKVFKKAKGMTPKAYRTEHAVEGS